MTRPHPRARRSGFAMFIAIAMISFLGVVLAALSLSLAGASERTANVRAGAQLRQLLLVGADHVMGEIAADGLDDTGEIPLSATIEVTDATLSWSTPHRDAQARTVVIAADRGSHRARQTLELALDGERWTLTRATLDRTR
ncbi:MAG: hypothetical protein WD009_13445 [Phycisphaeraceae bacterium]